MTIKNDYVVIPIKRGIDCVEELLDIVHWTGNWIAGGYARWCCSPFVDKNNYPGDIDIFCRSKDSYDKITDYFKYKESYVYATRCAVTCDIKNIYPNSFVKTVQIIKTKNYLPHGDPYLILNCFDFIISKCLIIDHNQCLVHKNFLDDEINKRISVDYCSNPINTFTRMLKYSSKYGYSVHASEIINIFENWEKINIEKRKDILKIYKSQVNESGKTGFEHFAYEQFTNGFSDHWWVNSEKL